MSVFHHISQETNTEALWEKLKGLYEKKTAQNKGFVARKLVNLKLKEGRSVVEHLSEFQDLVNQMVTMKLIIDDNLQALLLLSSLLDSWETLVVSFSNSAPNGVLQLAMVKDSLFNEETRRKTWARIMHRLLSQRIGGGVRLEILRGVVNPKVNQNRKENSSVSTMKKKVT